RQAADLVVAEARAAKGYTEAHYAVAGIRRIPVLRLLHREAEAFPPLGHCDVLLVTGGGNGIAPESAFGIAKASGLELALGGRYSPASDPPLAATLYRVAAAGVTVRYCQADVTDANAIQRWVRAAEAELGSITALLHGAGTNIPQLLSPLDEQACLRTLAPKV